MGPTSSAVLVTSQAAAVDAKRSCATSAPGPLCRGDGDCGAGQRCCVGSCVAGDCCGDGDCAPRVCLGNRCQPCTASTQCGGGQVCCGGLCRTAECCSDGDCKAGSACAAGHCRVVVLDERPLLDARPKPNAAVTPCSVDAQCGGGKCCDNGSGQTVCVSGNCCTSADCGGGLQCLQFVCQPCSGNSQCPSGQVCCTGLCQAGACCNGSLCANGQVCSAGACSSCKTNSDCGAGSICCSGSCYSGPNACCTNADCGQYVCGASHQCATCTSATSCGSKGVACCYGACVAGTCCQNSDCPSGQLCISGKCSSCTKDLDCGSGAKCCGGSCVSGQCCSTSNCSGGTVCNNNLCALCSSDSQCSNGQKCCSGKCTNGTCCVNTDCSSGVCVANSCSPCMTSAQCGNGRVCCNGGCQSGTCCSASDCSTAPNTSLPCIGNVCVPCTGDGQCAGGKCCNGTCITGVECCSNKDCPGYKTCKAGQCSTCVADADCGGLRCCTDSGGTARCLSVCSVTGTYGSAADFQQGSFNGAQPCASNPQAICWNGTAVVIQQPFIWLPLTDSGQAVRYDVNTGAIAGPFSTHDCDPSRTTVNPFDATIWVGNRGCDSIAHLDQSGNLLCYSKVGSGTDLARAVTTDALGNIWVGNYSAATMYKFSGSQVDKSTNPPTCVLLGSVAMPGVNPYGAATDQHNHIFVAAGWSDPPGIGEIDATTGAFLGKHNVPWGFYGITAGKTDIWMGSYQNGGVIRCSKGSWKCTFINTGGNPRGIAIDNDGYVFSAMWASSQIVRIDPNTNAVSYWNVNAGGNPIAVAVDTLNRKWAVDYSGPLTRFAPDGSSQVAFNTSGAHYVYSDVTGQQAVNAGLSPGYWTVTYDSQYATPHWTQLQLTDTVPNGTSVSAQVRTCATEADCSNQNWSQALTAFPANLTSLGLPSLRFIQVKIVLTTSDTNVSPQVSGVNVVWSPY